jgi:hypothetical protein
MLADWSWWQIVATAFVLWTAMSFLVALALGRVLRANLAFDVDAAERASEPESGDDDSGAEWVGPTVEPSLLDQLLPAELADDSAPRSSGTRFNPVHGQSNVEQLRNRRRIG